MKNRGLVRLAAACMAVGLLGSLMGLTVYAEEGENQESPFTEEELAYIAEGKTLKVGYVCDRIPVSFQGKDGELAGTSRLIFDRIAELSGLRFEYVPLPLGDITYDYLQTEGFDLVTSVEYNKENQKARGILISDPYLSSRKVIVARDSMRFESNAHYTAAISTGSQTIKKVIGDQYPNFTLVDYDSIEDCLDAVSKGEADLLIQNQYVAEHWLYKPIYHDLIAIPMLEMQDQLCFSAVVPIGQEDSAALEEKELVISIINKTIGQMSSGEVGSYIITSTLENMYEYSFSDFLYQYRYSVILLVIAALLITGLVYMSIFFRFRAIKAGADAKAKGDFLSSMSHEIRTPLNGLVSLNYLMSRNVDDEEKMREYLRQSYTVTQYLRSLLDNILDMSHLQSEKMELEQKPVDLKLLFATVDSVERNNMEEAGLTFRMEADLPCQCVTGDAVRIQQVLLNLLDNACKYTRRGGSVTVTAEQKESGEKVMTTVRVKDTGRGISEEFRKKIFTPFTQERETVSQGNQGTGLGLAICSLLAERMGGSLQVESALGEGSEFTFSFAGKRAALEEHTEMAETLREKPRILLAEDNELNGEILAEVLEEEGFEVLHVTDGQKAFQTFAASRPGEYGVILMDLLMPKMNGFEATKAIRALDRPDAATVKIFASTANTQQEDKEKAFASGMDDFIAKPINVKELLNKIQLAQVSGKA